MFTVHRERGYAEPLLTATLRLLPLPVFAYAEDCTGATSAPPKYQDLFLSIKDFSINGKYYLSSPTFNKFKC